MLPLVIVILVAAHVTFLRTISELRMVTILMSNVKFSVSDDLIDCLNHLHDRNSLLIGQKFKKRNTGLKNLEYNKSYM